MLMNRGLLCLTEIAGVMIYDPIGVRIGKISRVLLEPVTGRVRYVLVLFDFAGLDYDERAVPWTALHYNSAHGTFYSYVTRSQVVTAPQFDASQALTDEWHDGLHRHYSGAASA
jgi:hypothetical protein